jgi:hypothetical protein
MAHESWWVLDPVPGVLVWARLVERDDGGAEVFDSTGLTTRFPDETAARMYLLDLAYRAWDGLDDEDAAEMGFALANVAPPRADTELELLRAMTQRLAKAS